MKEESVWPDPEDGLFCKYIYYHNIQIIIHPSISTSADLSLDKTYSSFNPHFLQLSMPCDRTPDKTHHKSETLSLNHSFIVVSCMFMGVEWEKIGDEMKSYQDFRGQEVLLRITTLGTAKTLSMSYVSLRIESKHHKMEIDNFKEISCPPPIDYGKCYTSPVPKPTVY